MMAVQSRPDSLRSTRATTIRATLASSCPTDDNAMKSIKQLQAEEDERRRVFTAKIKQMRARESGRLGKIAENVKLIDYAVTDEELAAGLQHAIELALERDKREGSASESVTGQHAVGA